MAIPQPTIGVNAAFRERVQHRVGVSGSGARARMYGRAPHARSRLKGRTCVASMRACEDSYDEQAAVLLEKLRPDPDRFGMCGAGMGNLSCYSITGRTGRGLNLLGPNRYNCRRAGERASLPCAVSSCLPFCLQEHSGHLMPTNTTAAIAVTFGSRWPQKVNIFRIKDSIR